MTDAAWQPIETAPRDGTLIDLWHSDARRTDYYWSAQGYWTHNHGYPVVYRVLLDPPSHWMPLPAPPESRP